MLKIFTKYCLKPFHIQKDLLNNGVITKLMSIYLDSAVLEEAEIVKKYPFISGITCNPILLAKALGKNKISAEVFYNHLIELSKRTQGKIFIQTNFAETEKIIKEAQEINEVVPIKSIIKIPFSPDGLESIKILKSKKIPTACTAIFTAHQGWLAAQIGADFVIPYYNRITKLGGNGFKVTHDMLNILNKCNPNNSQILAASVKSLQEIEELISLGIQHLTLTLDMINQLTLNRLNQEAIIEFQKSLEIVQG